MCWDRRSEAPPHINITLATVNPLQSLRISTAERESGTEKETVGDQCNFQEWACLPQGARDRGEVCSAYGEPASVVTAGKGLKYKAKCLHSQVRRMNTKGV